MKFFSSNDYVKRRADLEQAVARTKARTQRNNDIALTSQRLKDAAFAAGRAMQADPSDANVQKFIDAHLRLRECDLWELAARMIRPTTTAENNKELLPVAVDTLKASISEYESRRKEILRDELELAQKHGDEQFDQAASPHLKRIDTAIRQAQDFLQRLSRGEDRVLPAAIEFLRRSALGKADATTPVETVANA